MHPSQNTTFLGLGIIILLESVWSFENYSAYDIEIYVWIEINGKVLKFLVRLLHDSKIARQNLG